MRPSVLVLALLVGVASAAPTAEHSTVEFSSLLEQAERVRSSDPAQFSKLLDQLQDLTRSATESERQQLRYLLAYRKAFRGETESAVHELENLFQEATDSELKFRVGAFLVNNYAVTRNFAEGLSYLDRTLSLIDEVESKELRHQGLYVASVLYNQVGQYDLGQSYAEQVLDDDPAPRTRCFAAQTRVEAMSYIDIERMSEESALSAIDWCEEQREPVVAGFARMALARKRSLEGNEKAVLTMLSEKLAEVQATRYPILVSEHLSTMAELALASGGERQADEFATAALEADPSATNSKAQATAYKVKSAVAKTQGRLSDALRFLQLGADADRANLGELQARQMAFHLAKLETLRKTQTIEILAKQNEVLKLQQQVAAQTVRSNQLLVALLIVLLGSLGLWAWRTKRVQISLRRMAEQDALTGVFNRRHFTALAEERLSGAAAIGKPVCLVMFDLDHFKHVNDSYGHPTGDWVLKQVATICNGNIRRNDLIGRMGGEEFAILLFGCEADSAMLLADHCREAVAAIDTQDTGHTFEITASFGVACARESGYDFKTLFSHADSALYASKHHGRNAVSLYEQTVAPTVQGAGAGLGDL